MRTNVLVLSAAVLFAATAVSLADDENSQAEETQAVQQAADDFYASLNALFEGDTTQMEKVWSHADDVTYLGPAGGLLVGWEQVQASWQKQADLKLGGKIEPADTHFVVGDDLAFSVCYEHGTNDVGGQTVPVSIRATNVFRKEHGQWKMIGHHTDILPFLQKQSLTKSVD